MVAKWFFLINQQLKAIKVCLMKLTEVISHGVSPYEPTFMALVHSDNLIMN